MAAVDGGVPIATKIAIGRATNMMCVLARGLLVVWDIVLNITWPIIVTNSG